MRDKEKLQALLRSALEASPADETELVAYVNSTSLTRFAKSVIHQNVREDNSNIFVRVAVGKRLGVTSTNQPTQEAIGRAIEKAIAMAKESPEQSDFPGLPKAPPAEAVPAYCEDTATMSPETRADQVGRAAEIASGAGVTVSGAYRVSTLSMGVMNTSGTEQHYDATDAYLSVFAMDDKGTSGSAADYAVDVGDIDAEELANTAVEKCKAAADPIAIDAGNYDVILEPRASGEIMEWLNFTAFGAKQVQEGMSFMAGRMGEKVMGDTVTIYDDGRDPEGVPIPFDFEGVPKKRVTIIDKGVASAPLYDTLTAAKDGVESTGHGGLAIFRGGPSASNLFIGSGDAEMADLMKAVKRGLLVTRFHYINGLLDTRKALFTGMTRDGTFLIENGKITKAVKNLRFNDSMLRAYSNVEALTQKRGIAGRNWGGIGSITAPTVLIRDFKFTGATEF
jgi:predicted Zn-dependent protease